MKILITGGSGYIAKGLYSELHTKYDITLASRADLDLLSREGVESFFKEKYFDIVIHAAVQGGRRSTAESPQIFMNNLLMYDNLMRCRHRFGKLIHFGSGAEDLATTPYGLSKHIIKDLMKLDEQSVNIKIYGLFDENELDTRFIKSNIIRYMSGEDMIIHRDKVMDFFYMKDLASMIDWLIAKRGETFPVQNIECSYLQKHTLVDIANMINKLDKHSVGISVLDNSNAPDYCGVQPVMPFHLIGLEQGIRNVYNKLR